jgi:hypothetical protein
MQQPGSGKPPLTRMNSSELSTQLSGVKDNSLVIANKYITGPLKIDAEQQPIVPVTFKVEVRDCEFADDVVVKKVEFGQSLILLRVKFDKRFDLDHVSVKGDLQLENVEAAKLIQVNQSQVDGDVRIKDPVASGLQIEYLTANNLIIGLGKNSILYPAKGWDLDFFHLSAGRLSLSAGAIKAIEVDDLNLNNVNLRETLTLQNLNLQKVDGVSLTVAKRTLFLPVTTIRKSLDLSAANLAGFEWRFAGPVQFPEKVEINSATLGSLDIIRGPPVGSERSETEASRLRADRSDYGLVFLERAQYYEPAYTFYESSLKSRGRSDKADGVYFAMRDRRRYSEFRDAYTLSGKIIAGFNYVIGFGHKWLFGYGRAWVYPLMWCVVFVLVGGYIFRDGERMQRVDETSSQAFSPIWYSLDIFLPILSLGVGKNWRPKEEHAILRFYSKFLSLIGLIFVSAMVGALTGTLK